MLQNKVTAELVSCSLQQSGSSGIGLLNSGWRPRWGRVSTGPRREQKRSHTAEFIGKKIL